MREAIDSAIAQTYRNTEIIVINDGSKDDGKTLAIAKSYGDKIRLIDKPNGGVATALNAGIEAMKGDYFSWLSHDDIYPPDKLEKQVAFLNTRTDKNILVFGDFQMIDENGHNMGRVSTAHIDTRNMLFELYAFQCIHGCTILVPKRVFDKIGTFRTDLPTTQDYDFWLRAATEFSYAYIPEILAYGRQHAGQGSRTLQHKDEVLEHCIRNFLLITPQWLDAHYTKDEILNKYLVLLQNFSNPDFKPIFLIVFRQACQHLAFKNRAYTILFICRVCKIFYTGLLKGSLKRMIPLKIKNLLRRNLNAPRGNKAGVPATLDFIKIYKKNIFGSKESHSGSGSTLLQTTYIREAIPPLLKKLHVKSMLDVPCGDFNWLRHVDLSGINYTGGDIVPDLVTKNNIKFRAQERDFRILNIITDDLPKVDLIFCRDCLVHLKFEDGLKAIENFKRSGSTYLLTTTFTDRHVNEDLFGIWRTLNLQKAPYNLPVPLEIINEKCTEGDNQFTDKSLGLWLLKDI